MNAGNEIRTVAGLPGSTGKIFPRLGFENRIQLGVVAAGLPAAITAVVCLWQLNLSLNLRLTLALAVFGCLIAGSIWMKHLVCYSLRTLSNLLGALREGDYSLRASVTRSDDVLGETLLEVNGLADLLRNQRLEAHEDQALLDKILAEVDVAVFALDPALRVRLVNRGGEKLLARSADEIIGRQAGELGLQNLLQGGTERIVNLALPGGIGRWKLHRGRYREDGRPHHLLILTDLTRTLHDEERAAWKRMLQILRHEINNSLAPICSIANSLIELRKQSPRPDDWEDDLRQGLEVIETRSESLHRFILAYSEVTRLPDPSPRPIEIGPWVRRVAELDGRLPVAVQEGPALTIEADGDQLDQLLINLIRNAIDAVTESDGGVGVGWDVANGRLHVWVDDDGPGVADADQAFTPFYTTKPDGAGIGLPLSRQIAENHGGALILEDSPTGRGCRASLYLPLKSATRI